MAVGTKSELLRQLGAERSLIAHVFNLGYVLQVADWRAELVKFSINPGVIEFALDGSEFEYSVGIPADIAKTYTPDVLTEACTELTKLALRNAVTQSYEAVASYASTRPSFQASWEIAAWRPLARLLRNCFSHDFVIDFWDRKRKCLRPDVSYTFPSGKAVHISNSLHGQVLNGDTMSIEVVPLLLDEMRNFVEIEG
jgi:hypothetical protein